MATALSADAVETLRKYDRNARWAMNHGDALDRYEDQYVAVVDEEVVASGKSVEAVRNKVRGKVGVYIGHVPKRGLLWML